MMSASIVVTPLLVVLISCLTGLVVASWIAIANLYRAQRVILAFIRRQQLSELDRLTKVDEELDQQRDMLLHMKNLRNKGPQA